MWRNCLLPEYSSPQRSCCLRLRGIRGGLARPDLRHLPDLRWPCRVRLPGRWWAPPLLCGLEASVAAVAAPGASASDGTFGGGAGVAVAAPARLPVGWLAQIRRSAGGSELFRPSSFSSGRAACKRYSSACWGSPPPPCRHSRACSRCRLPSVVASDMREEQVRCVGRRPPLRPAAIHPSSGDATRGVGGDIKNDVALLGTDWLGELAGLK